MTNLLAQVTPLTKGLLWITNGAVTSEKSFYKDVDYLLNGLLTATLKTSAATGGHVLVSENFGNIFYVMVGSSVSENEIKNFFDLIKPQLSDESDILLIDENDSFSKIQKMAPVDIKSKIHVIQ